MMKKLISLYLKILSIIAVCVSLSANAYQIADGVPNPMQTWVSDGYTGNVVNPINGEAPASWDIAKNLGLPAYYIDSGHSAATNTNNPFGSPDKPRSSIPEITYDAGSYVEIHGGPYNGGGQLLLTANGTPDKPVWIRGESFENRALISGETIVKGQYIILENLEYNTPKNTISFRSHNGSYLHHAVIRNSVFLGDGKNVGNGSAVAIYGASPENRFHDIIVYNNVISKFGDDFDDVDPSLGLSTENDYHGVLAQTNVDRVWIVKNKIYNLGGDSVQVGIASTADDNRISHVYISDNDFYTNLENGVDVKEADNTLIIGNRIWGYKEHKNNSSTGSAVVIHNTASHTWIVNNEISDASTGISVTGGSLNTWVVGNIIKNIKHPNWNTAWNGGLYDSGAAVHFRGGSSGGVINNTIINYDKGIEAANGNVKAINNILYNRNDKLGKDIWSESSQTEFLVSNNLVYPKEFPIALNNVTCTSCSYDVPGFSDPSLELVTIRDDSTCVGRGGAINTIQDLFTSVFNETVTKDIYAGDRVVGGIDLGASENQFSLYSPTVEIPMKPVISGIELK